jgi:hypothetical protein
LCGTVNASEQVFSDTDDASRCFQILIICGAKRVMKRASAFFTA